MLQFWEMPIQNEEYMGTRLPIVSRKLFYISYLL